jgi:hypothetical protein
MQAGDRVCLNRRLAQSFTKRSRSKKQINWFTRVGEIVTISRTAAVVRWDDRKSVDHWPPQALSLLNE